MCVLCCIIALLSLVVAWRGTTALFDIASAIRKLAEKVEEAD